MFGNETGVSAPFSVKALFNITSASVTKAFAPLIALVAMYRDIVGS